jgi:WD40 repeat protein
MNPATLGRLSPRSALRRWRALHPRRRVALVLTITTLLAVVVLSVRWLGDPWPARAVLRAPGDTWPLAFSPDGRTFLTSGRGGITPWDAPTGRKRETWPIEEGRSAVKGAFSPDGKTFAAATFAPSRPISITWFDPATGRTKATLPSPYDTIYHLAFTADGRELRAFLGNNPQLKEVVTWDTATGREIARRPITAPTQAGITAFSPDGRTLAITASRANAVQLWDLDADRALGGLANLSTTSPAAWGGVGFSGDGRTLAIGRDDGTIELWDLATQRVRKTLKGHSDGYASGWVRFSPDGRTIASASRHYGATSTLSWILDGLGQAMGLNPKEGVSEVIVLDVATGRRLARASSSIHPSFSPDGRIVATRERDLSVRLRDVPGR